MTETKPVPPMCVCAEPRDWQNSLICGRCNGVIWTEAERVTATVQQIASGTQAGSWRAVCSMHGTLGTTAAKGDAVMIADNHNLHARWEHRGSVSTTAVPPLCLKHKEVQHRDQKPPWCDNCGWTHGKPAVPPSKQGEPRP